MFEQTLFVFKLRACVKRRLRSAWFAMHGVIRRHRTLSFYTLISFGAACFVLAFVSVVQAADTVPHTMHFQGRLADASNSPKADGLYNMTFRFYTAASGGTAVWSEAHETTNRVQITNGLFSTELGSVTPIPASLFASGQLYFEVELPTPETITCATAGCASYTLGPLSARSAVSTSAYAFNADAVDGIDGSVLARNDTANTFTGAQTVQANNTNAFKVTDGTTTLFAVDTTNSQVRIGAADTKGAVLVLDTKTDAGDPSAVAGAMYYNASSGKMRCAQSGGWADCVTAVTTTLQDAYNNSASPAAITTTATKGVQIIAGAPPAIDLLKVDNAANPTTTNNTNAIALNYAGGSGAIEGAGMRVDYVPGGTSGSSWSGVRIVANANGAAAGVKQYGIKLEGPSVNGAGTETAAYIGTGWDIGMDIQSGGLQLASQDDPGAPAAGNLRIYAKDVAGRVMPKWIGPSGVDTPFQANLGFNRVSMIMPAGGTTATTVVGGFGTTFTNSASTYSNPTPTTTSFLSSLRRTTYNGTTTAGTLIYHRQSVLQVWRGNTTGRGGFFFTTRFGTSATTSGNRAFVGLSNSVANPTNVDPTTSATISKVGMAINANTGNWNIVHNAAGVAPTVVPLDNNFPVNTTDVYELVLYSAPNGSSIGYRVTNKNTSQVFTGSMTTNLPASNAFLSPQFWMTNNATGAAFAFDFNGWYLESDD